MWLKACVCVCACLVSERVTQKREFCSCHLLAEVVVIFYKGGHFGGGKGGNIRLMVCPSFDRFIQLCHRK